MCPRALLSTVQLYTPATPLPGNLTAALLQQPAHTLPTAQRTYHEVTKDRRIRRQTQFGNDMERRKTSQLPVYLTYKQVVIGMVDNSTKAARQKFPGIIVAAQFAQQHTNSVRIA